MPWQFYENTKIKYLRYFKLKTWFIRTIINLKEISLVDFMILNQYLQNLRNVLALELFLSKAKEYIKSIVFNIWIPVIIESTIYFLKTRDLCPLASTYSNILSFLTAPFVRNGSLYQSIPDTSPISPFWLHCVTSVNVSVSASDYCILHPTEKWISNNFPKWPSPK